MASDGVSTWDGVTLASSYKGWVVEGRGRLADAARDGDWGAVFRMLEEHPEWVNCGRVGGRSGFAPLHQVAWRGAEAGVAERLVRLGAWRTLRTSGGERAVDIATRRGHRDLVEVLGPVIRHEVPGRELDVIERRFHELIRERAGELVAEQRLRLPQLEPLTEQPNPACWFAVPGMYGGFSYRLERATLVVESWSRVVGGSGQRHVIDARETRLVDEGFV